MFPSLVSTIHSWPRGDGTPHFARRAVDKIISEPALSPFPGSVNLKATLRTELPHCTQLTYDCILVSFPILPFEAPNRVPARLCTIKFVTGCQDVADWTGADTPSCGTGSVERPMDNMGGNEGIPAKIVGHNEYWRRRGIEGGAQMTFILQLVIGAELP
jgi:hypothetical protein